MLNALDNFRTENKLGNNKILKNGQTFRACSYEPEVLVTPSHVNNSEKL